jgi:hypothetical protein
VSSAEFRNHGKSSLFCHSERSEESLFLWRSIEERFLASLGMKI